MAQDIYYTVPMALGDIDLFDSANDLPKISTPIRFNDYRLQQNIEINVRRAQLQNEAEAQMLLAQLFKDDAYRHLEHLEKAEASAFTLGEISFRRGKTTHNPFQDIALATAWYNGYTQGARSGREEHLNDLEAKLWNEGVNTENAAAQYELVAVTLMRLATGADNPKISVRAQRLAQEMMIYHAGRIPSPRRQQEIDRFLQLQTQRLAAALDITDL